MLKEVPSVNEKLRNAGLKVTFTRVSVLQALTSAKMENTHLSAEDVYRNLGNSGDDVRLATVYRVLGQLEAAGLVARHHFDGGRSLFELTTGDRHDHMVCLDSRDIVDFSEPDLKRQLQQTAQEHGYELADYELVLYVNKTEGSG